MRNKVVHMLARSLQMHGISTVRFNYRGVGSSAGIYDDGLGETEDAVAVARWSRDRWPLARLVAAGFSFGAAVALRTAIRIEATRLVTVAPPVDRLLIDPDVPVPDCPWLVIHGSSDELIPLAAVEQWVGTRVPSPTLVIIDAADHFFHGKLIELRDAVFDWMERSH
jgi:alpha/beta superfamily hydrolase